MHDAILIKGARQNNLKNVTVRIPKYKLVVLTGLSGSGKSTLAFETLHKEGQRQYMESMGLVTDYLSKPKMEGIEGLSPTISVDQHLTNRSPRSTVGTETEIYTYLRILFAKIGHRPCPVCGRDVAPPHMVEEVGDLSDDPEDKEGEESTYPCPHCGTRVPELTMGHFSFNRVAGACPACTGLGVVNSVDLAGVIDEAKSVRDGGILGWDWAYLRRFEEAVAAAEKLYGFRLDLDLPIGHLGPVQRDYLLHGTASAQFRRHYPAIAEPSSYTKGRFEGVVTNFMRRYAEHIEDAKYREKMERYMTQQPCGECGGERLKAESRQVTVAGQTIIALSRMPLTDLNQWLKQLNATVAQEERAIVQPILDDLDARVRRVLDVGVGYLTMERATPSLSGGEAQRLRLASLLGSGLSGVIYVLDEPSIGLHQRDTGLLINILRRLRDLGNTVVVIEHDLEIVAAADYVIDMGPGAGRHGGQVMAAGTVAEVAQVAESPTGRWLGGAESVPVPVKRRPGIGADLTVHGARAHNLKDITARIPLGTLTALTGVSGSGKSSLLFDILDRAARQRFYGTLEKPGEHDRIEGWEHLERVITIDQVAIGRTPRSNAATYTDAFAAIRKLYAGLKEAKAAKLTETHFSFNVPGGRCEKCKGAGVLTVTMHFLPDVEVRCPACHGRRFRHEVLGVRYQGASVADVLGMTIEEAAALFRDVPAVSDRLSVMVDCGLGYLQLGQPATTLSGGEAQRVKLAKELGRRGAGHTLYLLDEPTTGLHPADTARLLKVLHGLVDGGNTVVVVEHNLELVKTADWVIDLGPEGGEAGGWLLAEGTPEAVARVQGSYTGRYLRPTLE